jgi:hypothetical protein
MNRKLLLIAGILAVALILLAAFYFFYKKSRFGSNVPEVQTFAVTKQDLPDSQIPSGFPADLPLEADTQVTQNYEATTTDGRKQSKRIFSTTKTLAQAMQIYTNFFTRLDWVEIPTPNSEPGSLVSLLRKGDDVLNISVKTDSKTNLKTVELTLTETPK